MLVDGGASVNILPLSVFKKLGHGEGDLKRTNLCLSSSSREPTEAKGIVCNELTVGSKTVPTVFFMVDMKGRYNVLLRRDWIHVNKYVPSTLHQCIVQWILIQVEVVKADDTVCVAVAESQEDVQGGCMKRLTGRDLTDYDYVSVGKEGFVPISVKPMISATRHANDIMYMADKRGDVKWLHHRTEQYRSSKEDIRDVVKDLEDIGKLGRCFSAIDELEEVDIGDGITKQPTYVGE
jgi:hypothetical protein